MGTTSMTIFQIAWWNMVFELTYWVQASFVINLLLWMHSFLWLWILVLFISDKNVRFISAYPSELLTIFFLLSCGFFLHDIIDKLSYEIKV
jgi:hypothetical protein